jgi:hypothetical protein
LRGKITNSQRRWKASKKDLACQEGLLSTKSFFVYQDDKKKSRSNSTNSKSAINTEHEENPALAQLSIRQLQKMEKSALEGIVLIQKRENSPKRE